MAEQTQDVEFIYDEIQEDGTIERTIRMIRTRYVFRFEMELLLQMSGYKVVDLFGGYNGQRFDYYSGVMGFVVEKAQ